ncbi:hypothetical protein KC571_04030 [candidate division WWE3 bacterium]|uniref:DUF4870 domain-containing protein n=1 Tax=candidate division WWE3 bacterium TaxID=2053526 RepID=A0A955LHG8_UNCKA|nr:hypothetical protein [candidate division WWE3 bacterium]
MNAALTYFLGWITGIVFLFTEKDDAFIRFHAAQSTIVFGVLTVLSFIPIIQIFTGWIGLILWVFLMYKAYSGEKYSLPTVGELAEQLKDQIGK